MRYLGIDYGRKRIGVAISDPEGKIAFSEAVVPNDKNAVETISDLILAKGVGGVVIGQSKDFLGRPNKIQKEIDSFGKSLEAKEMEFEIIFEPEFLTSAQMERDTARRHSTRGPESRPRRRKKDEKLDAKAAAVILQSYLDRKNLL